MAQNKRNRKNKKEPYPATIRYNKRKPGVTIRMDAETLANLDAICEITGKTRSEVIRDYINGLAAKLMSIEEARNVGYALALREGKKLYGVSFPCAECGQTIFIEGPELIAQVRELIIKARWGHAECPKPTPAKQPVPRPNPPTGNTPKPNPTPAASEVKFAEARKKLDKLVSKRES